MKLSKVRIKEFQSIRDSNEFDTNEITCLVGKNEAGKTSILQALYKLNPIISGDGRFDITDDYPRVDVEDYLHDVEQGKREHAIVAEATFTLDDEIEKIGNDFGYSALMDREFVLYKGYANTTNFRINVNEKQAFRYCLQHSSCSWDLKDALKDANRFSEAHTVLESFKPRVEDETLITLIKNVCESDFANYLYSNYIQAYIPKFLYFDSYYQLTGQENIEALKQRIDSQTLLSSDYPMLGLLSLARIDIEQLLNPERTQELVNKIEGAGNHLSKKVLRYWSQNKFLQMKFDVRAARAGDPEGMRSGTNLWATVYDNKRWVTTNLSARSKGFVWFFSFLSWYSKINRENQNVILLLDEPGLFLHAKAQYDLLRYFEQELKPFHQLIYTTHSPFMIDSANIERVRIVQDISINSEEELPEDEMGTKVLQDFSGATEESLFPVQGALGYEIHQSLIDGPNCLIVGDTSELLYLQTISGVLDRKGRIGLSREWTLTPVGGSNKIPTFIALLSAQSDTNIATLINIQKEDIHEISSLLKRMLLDQKKVLTYSDFIAIEEADIEDMFDLEFYLELLKLAYKRDIPKKLKVKDIMSQHPRTRVKMDHYVTEHPMRGGKVFNHYIPARYFAENIGALERKLSEDCLNRFELIFRKLNELLVYRMDTYDMPSIPRTNGHIQELLRLPQPS